MKANIKQSNHLWKLNWAWGALFALTPFPAFGAESYISYELRKNETVGHVLAALGKCQLWGKGSWVEKTLRLNKIDVAAGEDRRLLPGRKIILPFETLPDSSVYAISSDGALKFMPSALDGKCTESQSVPPTSAVSEPEEKPQKAQTQLTPTDQVESTVSSWFRFEPIPYELSLGIGAETGVMALTGTQVSNNSSASLSSGFNLGFDFQIAARLAKVHTLQLDLSTAPRTFAAVSNRRYLDNSSYYSAFALTYSYPTEFWGLIPSVTMGYRQTVAYHSETLTVLQFDRVGTPLLGVGLSKLISESGNWRLSGGLGYQYYFPVTTVNYNVLAGSGLHLGGKLDYQWSSESMISGQLRLFSEQQNTSILNINRDTYELKMMYVREISK
jgi:hypothetical protein